MNKYRIHFDARNPSGNGGISGTIDVSAESDHTAITLANAQFIKTYSSQKNYEFIVKKIEKK